jgi:large subunit ribosomal protein L10
LTAEEFYNFRNEGRKAGVYIKMLRNRLASRALENTQFACLQPVLKGPILLAFSMKEPNSAARLLRDFSKKHENLVVKHLAFEGQLLEARDLGTMADLPSREEAIARLLAVLQAPLRKMLYVLSEPPAKFIRVLSAMKDR